MHWDHPSTKPYELDAIWENISFSEIKPVVASFCVPIKYNNFFDNEVDEELLPPAWPQLILQNKKINDYMFAYLIDFIGFFYVYSRHFEKKKR